MDQQFSQILVTALADNEQAWLAGGYLMSWSMSDAEPLMRMEISDLTAVSF
jgi:hypothetical protein